MAVDYERVNWQDYPATDTPITAANLNKMDEGVYNNAVNIGDMDLIASESDGTVCGNIDNLNTETETLETNMGKIKVYVGDDEKLHFVDSTGADTALNFSRGVQSATLVHQGGGTVDATIGKTYVMMASARNTDVPQIVELKNVDRLCWNTISAYDSAAHLYVAVTMDIGKATSDTIYATAAEAVWIWELN